MAYELRDGQGSLFKNKKKSEGDNKPDYWGNGLLDGKKVKLAAWIKTSAAGEKFMSLKLEREDAVLGESSPAPALVKDVVEDDIPF